MDLTVLDGSSRTAGALAASQGTSDNLEDLERLSDPLRIVVRQLVHESVLGEPRRVVVDVDYLDPHLLSSHTPPVVPRSPGQP